MQTQDLCSVQQTLTSIIARHAQTEGALLPILHDIQDSFGHVPADAHPAICAALGISRAELHGVLTFYHDFRDQPGSAHVLRLCRAEACQSMGGEALGDALRQALGLDWHGTSADGRLTLEPVYCLGLCACAPAAMLDDRLIGRATLPRLLAEVRP